MKTITINKDISKEDNIEVIKNGELILVSLNKSDLDNLKQEKDIYQCSCIYLLLSDNTIYIGQANEFGQRISKHSRISNVNKIYFFTNTERKIEKATLNYLERELIKNIKTNREIDNDNNGQETHIALENRISANNLLKLFDDTLDMFNISFDLSFNNEHYQEEVENQDYTVTFMEKTYNLNDSTRTQVEVYLEVIRDIYQTNSSFIDSLTVSSSPTATNIFGKSEKISSSGSKCSKEHIGRHVYTNLGLIGKKRTLENLIQKYNENNLNHSYCSR